MAEQLATNKAKCITSEWHSFYQVHVHESETAQQIPLLQLLREWKCWEPQKTTSSLLVGLVRVSTKSMPSPGARKSQFPRRELWPVGLQLNPCHPGQPSRDDRGFRGPRSACFLQTLQLVPPTMGIVPASPTTMRKVCQTASRQGILGVRTLHDAPHHRTVHQVAVFVHCDDDARHVCAKGPRGTPEAFANGFHQVNVHRIHTAAKHSDESLTAPWLWH